MNNYYLGIDTSAYTTSIGVIDNNGEVIFDKRNVLKVKEGEKGLRQQEAVFQHINNLPFLISEMTENIDVAKICTISTSSKPRDIEGSYMPVFVVGKEQAFILSKILNVPFKEFSHQEGHISAGVLSNCFMERDRFLAVHLSGGTTELLHVENNTNFEIKLIGGTLDISVGQLIDRIGVKLGFKFPCGKQMDSISQKGNILFSKVPVSTKKTWANFSGTENFFVKNIEANKFGTDDIIKTLFYTVGLSILNMVLAACIEYDIDDVLIIGGVASNSFIRDFITKNLNKYNINVVFPNKELCSDNAIGTAYLGKVKNGHVWRK